MLPILLTQSHQKTQYEVIQDLRGKFKWKKTILGCISYLLKTNQRRNTSETQTEYANRAESLTSFFQSLFPSFNAENLRQNQAAATGPLANAAAANGVGMNQIVNRLREFLAAVELNFPAEPTMANQNNLGDDAANQSQDEFDWYRNLRGDKKLKLRNFFKINYFTKIKV